MMPSQKTSFSVLGLDLPEHSFYLGGLGLYGSHQNVGFSLRVLGL